MTLTSSLFEHRMGGAVLALKLRTIHILVSLILLCVVPTRALTYRGADISSLGVVESSGIEYKTASGRVRKFENILKSNGMNTARVRLWTSGPYSTEYGLALAKVNISWILSIPILSDVPQPSYF